MNEYYNILKDYVRARQDKDLVIFGAGDKASKIIPEYFTYDSIRFICDNNQAKWGKQMMGIPICSPDCLSDAPDKYTVIISIDDYVAVDSIKELLYNIGIKDVFHYSILSKINTFWRYDASLNFVYHELNTYKTVNDAANKISIVRDMLNDEKSIMIYNHMVDKVKYNISDYSDICDNWNDHYFSDGLIKYDDNEIFVDGGAFDGADTIRYCKLLGNRLKKAYIFEPDYNNFNRLCKNISNFCSSDDEIKKFSLHCSGLLDVNEDNVNFIHWGNYGSRIVEGDSAGWSSTDGYSSTRKGGISVVCLDDIIPESEKVTLIKLDVEGAERAALNGAKRIIVNNRPKMAISIYHKVDDLWEIPLLLKSFVPEYKLYVRHHSLALGDKVLFACV